MRLVYQRDVVAACSCCVHVASCALALKSSLLQLEFLDLKEAASR